MAGVRRAEAREPLPFDARRRPGDAVRLLVGGGIVGLVAARAAQVGRVDRAVYDFCRELPGFLHGVVDAVVALGPLPFLLVVLLFGVRGRPLRAARDWLVGSGLVALVCLLLGQILTVPGPAEHFGALDWFGAAYPALGVALTMVAIGTIGPFATRPLRIFGVIYCLLYACGTLYLCLAFTHSVVGGLALGWAAVAAVHLLFGRVVGRPTTAEIAESLRRIGIEPESVHAVTVRAPVAGAAYFSVVEAGGRRLDVKAIGRDQADAAWTARVWRRLAYKDRGPQRFLTRAQTLEHEAFAMVMAERAGVSVPRLVTIGAVGARDALIVVAHEEGVEPLAAGGTKPRLPDLLRIWRALDKVHEVGLAHGNLSAETVAIKDGRVILTGWGEAVTAAGPEAKAKDVAQLIAALAPYAGTNWVNQTAVDELPEARVSDAIRYLQSACLPEATRDALGHKELERLRADLAERVNEPEPKAMPLRRFTVSSLLTVALTGVAVYAMLPVLGELSSSWSVISSANWWWVLGGLGVYGLTVLGNALAQVGAVPQPIPLGPVTELMVASPLINLAVPANLGSYALSVRLFQGFGVPAATAVASITLVGVAGTCCQLAFVAICVAFSSNTFAFGNLTSGSAEIIPIIAVVAIVVGVALWIPKLRHWIWPPVARALRDLWSVVRNPHKAALVVGGNSLAIVAYAGALSCCVTAFGSQAALATCIVATVSASLLTSVVPVPGGLGVTEATMVSVFTVSGMNSAVAVAAVLTYRLISFWLPPLPGWFALRGLRRRHFV